MSVGRVLEGRHHAKYAQPRIEYRLLALAKLRTQTGEAKDVEAERLIPVIPCMDPTPPVEIDDFPGEFVGAIIHTFRTSFLGPPHLMTVSMPEPSPLPMGTTQRRKATTLRLMIEIQAAAGTNASHGFLDLFRRLLFKIQPILRAKTYYSTQPFSMMPSQTMATTRGPVRFHDSMLKLPRSEFSSSS